MASPFPEGSQVILDPYTCNCLALAFLPPVGASAKQLGFAGLPFPRGLTLYHNVHCELLPAMT